MVALVQVPLDDPGGHDHRRLEVVDVEGGQKTATAATAVAHEGETGLSVVRNVDQVVFLREIQLLEHGVPVRFLSDPVPDDEFRCEIEGHADVSRGLAGFLAGTPG